MGGVVGKGVGYIVARRNALGTWNNDWDRS